MTTTDQRDRIAADETPKPIPKRRRPAWWVYVTLVLLILLGGVGGFYGVWHYRANSELQAAIAAARQRGEPVWFADLEPEPIPAEENAAPFFIEAAELLGPESTAFDAALRQAMQTSRTGDAAKSLAPVRAKLQAGIDSNQAALAKLREGLKKPRYQFPYDYHARFPHSYDPRLWGKTDRIAYLLQAQFCLALADRDVPRAVQAIDDYYAAAALYWQDPFQTNEGCSCAHMATYELMLLVSQHALTDEQIARLDARLDALASSFRMRDSILAQRAELLALLDSYGDSDSPFYRNKALPECYFPLLVMEEQAFLMRYTSELARVADLPGPAGLQAASDLQQQYDQIPERFKVVADFFSFRPTSFRTMSLAPRQCLQNARVGIRVDRHLRKHGRLPGSFSEVLDDRLTEPPKCLFSGLPLILKPDQEGGFVIYAPGDNGIDNGAELGPNRDHQEIAYAFYVRYPPGMKRSKP